MIEGLSSEIILNITDFNNLKEIWNTLKRISLEIGQRLVYSVL